MTQPTIINLPPSKQDGGMPLAEAIVRRRSIRNFTPAPVSQLELSQILWAAQGITDASWKCRTVPSAGATYPLETFVVCGRNGVEKIEAGIYHYDIDNHALNQHRSGDVRPALAQAALGEEGVNQAPVNIVICAVYERTLTRYNTRGERYIHMEVGHAGQNIYLQAAALGLATFAIGAFYDEQVREVLQLDKRYKPLYIMPMGKPV